MSLAALDLVLKEQPNYRSSIFEVYDFLSQQAEGDFEDLDRIENFLNCKRAQIEWVLNAFIRFNALKKDRAAFCPDCDLILEDNTASLSCDSCHKSWRRKDASTKDGFRLCTVFEKRSVFLELYNTLSSLTEFQNRVLNSICRQILSLRQKQPSWLRQVVSRSKEITFSESLYRDDLEHIFKVCYEATSEVTHTKGRSDLIVRKETGSYDSVIGEFKIWGRNDYADCCDQVSKYMTSYENVGFIYMINDGKSSILANYVNKVILENSNYVTNSLARQPIVQNLPDFHHFRSRYKMLNREIEIFHFIFDNRF